MEIRDNIHDVKVCRGAPLMTDLLFADDFFFAGQRNEKQENYLKH